jgi:hypothetical protein
MDEPLLEFFAFDHLPAQLQEHSRPFVSWPQQFSDAAAESGADRRIGDAKATS